MICPCYGKYSATLPPPPPPTTTLQRQNAVNLKQIIPEKEYRGLSPNFNIHVSVSELYCIYPRWDCLFCWRKYVDLSWEYINRSQTHKCGNWGWGRAIPRKGIYKRNCRCSAQPLWQCLWLYLSLVFIDQLPFQMKSMTTTCPTIFFGSLSSTFYRSVE